MQLSLVITHTGMDILMIQLTNSSILLYVTPHLCSRELTGSILQWTHCFTKLDEDEIVYLVWHQYSIYGAHIFVQVSCLSNFSIIMIRHPEQEIILIWTTIAESMAPGRQAGRHATGTVAESSYIEKKTRKQRKLTGNGMSFWNIKAHPQWHTSYNKAIPPNPSKQVHHGDQVLQYMRTYGRPFSFKSPHLQENCTS